jgi:2'-hydroxyisoflavone reductase
MKVLVIGGSHFVGRALVEVALQSGHEVTALNRGLTGHVVDGARLIRADRTNHEEFSAALEGHSWDAVIDTWSGPPIHATVAARLLGPLTQHYAYVSSRSVYSWPIAPGLDESQATVDGDPEDAMTDDYALTKRGSELGVLAARPDALIARAGLILGPYEDIGRLPWWLLRLQRGGKVLAPGPVTRPLQLIDARDLAQWMMSCAERKIGGVFNAVSAVGHTTMGELLDVAREVTRSVERDVATSAAELVWFTPEEIEAAGVSPWTELPIWIPPTGPLAGLHDCDVGAALNSGLRCRPIRETVEDTWKWLQREGLSDQAEDRARHGLDPQREIDLIAAHETAHQPLR